MTILIIGLVLFLGIHSVQILVPQFRDRQVAKHGEGVWKGVYSLISAVGLVALIFGYGLANDSAVQIFTPPTWGSNWVILTMPVALVLFIASQLPAGKIKRTVRHPMIISILIWSAGHLVASGDTASVLLFGSFALWVIADLPVAFRRPAVSAGQAALWPDIIALTGGPLLAWVFLIFLHELLTGVAIS